MQNSTVEYSLYDTSEVLGEDGQLEESKDRYW